MISLVLHAIAALLLTIALCAIVGYLTERYVTGIHLSSDQVSLP